MCAVVYAGVQGLGCVQMCMGMGRHGRVCEDVHWHVCIYIGACRYARACAGVLVPECACIKKCF